MAKYDVIWYDAGDETSGTSFQVEGDNLIEAYKSAEKYITGLSDVLRRRFCPGDIEILVDEQGKSHYTWDFLRDNQ